MGAAHFYLFIAVLALIIAILLLEPTPRGQFMLNVGNVLVVVAAVGRTQLSFVFALLMAAPALLFQCLSTAPAAYLMIGVLWAYLYAIANHLQPGSFAFGGAVVSPLIGDMLYLSFTVLTSTGFGDAVPVLRTARGLCVLEQLRGALFLAILIARLAGVYPPRGPLNG